MRAEVKACQVGLSLAGKDPCSDEPSPGIRIISLE